MAAARALVAASKARIATTTAVATAAASTSARRVLPAAAAPAARHLSSSAYARASSPPSPVAPEGASAATAAAVPGSEGKDPQLGDYPDLPPISLQRRRWTPNWWDPQEKRNFGETLHEQHDALSVWAPDVSRIPPSSALFQFAFVSTIIAGVCGFIYLIKFESPAVPRTYPRNGLKAELGGTEFNARSSDASEEGDDADE